MSELKPCPFCGGPVELEEANSTRDSLYGERRWWGVVCRNTINLGGSCAIQQRPSASKEAAIERWNRRAQPAQTGQVLSDEEVKATALEAFDCTWDADDETLVNKYGHGVYLWRFVDFTRAIEQAVRAKLGVAVPMTPRDYAAALDSAIENDDIDGDVDMWTFIAGIKAAEKFHGIVGKESA